MSASPEKPPDSGRIASSVFCTVSAEGGSAPEGAVPSTSPFGSFGLKVMAGP